MSVKFYQIFAASLIFGFAAAQDEVAYEKAVESISKDLDAELKKLVALRKKIAAEKPALARKANKSALALRQTKRQYEIAKTTQAAIDHELSKRDGNLKLWRDERLYIDGMLAEFRKNYRGVIPLPEANALDAAFKDANRDGDAGTSASLKLVESMTQQLEELGSVRVIEGNALGVDGVMIPGKFAIAGPISWFASTDGAVSGLVMESRSLQSSVVAGTSNLDAITTLLEGGNAEVSFDPTLGNAIAMEEVQGNIFSYIRKGGVWVYPILALAVIAFFAGVAKWIQLLKVRAVRPAVVQEIIDAVNRKDSDTANAAVNRISHPVKSLLQRGIEVSDLPIDDVEESLYEKYLEAQPRLQRGLALIAIASATSPLLGLLGTVTGMIKTFNQITIFGTGDARSLSGGISEALITTAFGLIVAIPALILHALLSRKIQGIRSTMEMVSLAFINGLKKKHD